MQKVQNQDALIMATLMADEKSHAEIATTLPHAQRLIDAVDDVMDWAIDKSPRPKKKPFDEWIDEWMQVAEQMNKNMSTV